MISVLPTPYTIALLYLALGSTRSPLGPRQFNNIFTISVLSTSTASIIALLFLTVGLTHSPLCPRHLNKDVTILLSPFVIAVIN